MHFQRNCPAPFTAGRIATIGGIGIVAIARNTLRRPGIIRAHIYWQRLLMTPTRSASESVNSLPRWRFLKLRVSNLDDWHALPKNDPCRLVRQVNQILQPSRILWT